jgi:hypothetical protein
MHEVERLSNEIESVLENYIRQGEALLSQYKRSKKQTRDISSEISRDGLSEFAGLFAGEVVPGTRRKVRKYSRKVLEAQSRAKIEHLRKDLLGKFESWFSDIMAFLSSISIKKAYLEYPGNSELLKRKFSSIHGYVKPDTKVRNTILVLRKIRNLPLVYNRDIPELVERKKPTRKEPYKILEELETGLRELIQRKLAEVCRNWWKERVPKDVRDRAELRRKNDERQYPWHKKRSLPLVFYIDFTDYVKIIVRRNNWREVFKQVFKDKDIISTKLRELEPIRNAIAHFRELNQAESDKLKLYSEDIISCMYRH